MASVIPTRHQNRAKQAAPQLFRVGGSGFTAFHWQGQTIGFAQGVTHTSPTPVAAPSPIQPLDAGHPLQIITPAAIGPGSLQVALYEMYNQKVWDQIMQIVDNTHPNSVNTNKLPLYNDLRDVFIRMANIGKGISCTKIIYPPNKVQANKTQFYADTYHNVVITNIDDGEQIDIGTMEIVKNISLMYTRVTRSRHNA